MHRCLRTKGIPGAVLVLETSLPPASPGDIAGISGSRRLVAVIHADVVGYSRLVGVDDVGTCNRLVQLRQNLIGPALIHHGGQLVNTAGDSMLLAFSSVTGAVRCALELQRQIADYNRVVPVNRHLRFRMGVNIGDALSDGQDLYGNSINVAARLQAVCPPGKVCISHSVRDQVQDQVDVAFKRLGTPALKNIARPPQAFVMVPREAGRRRSRLNAAVAHGTHVAAFRRPVLVLTSLLTASVAAWLTAQYAPSSPLVLFALRNAGVPSELVTPVVLHPSSRMDDALAMASNPAVTSRREPGVGSAR